MKERAGNFLLLVAAVGGALMSFLALPRACSKRSPPACRGVEMIHERDRSVLMAIPAMEFTMGSSDAHSDLPAQPLDNKSLHPPDVLLARAYPSWRQADERPARRVRLNAFAIDRFEVTNAQYRRFLAEITKTGDHGRCHPAEPEAKDHTPRYWREFNPLLKDAAYARTAPFGLETFKADNQPVVGVDWFDAYAYAAWAGKRLPTEAEWELAARGPDGRRWPWGNDWRWGLANSGGEQLGTDIGARGREKDGFIYAAPAGSFPEGRSPFGCDDMAGNVAEWCADWYQSDYYQRGPEADPRGPAGGQFRVVRGGSSQNFPSALRCAARECREPEFRTFNLGFRCARDP
ncbi:MAG: formylglycine-generating enzyme family protein [Planctomycetes bacterium]|nr:formylglycine-generating enzyme family protein [Planctomycetota bacterium]